VVRPTIIELARRSAGLTQAELARRAGTTQSTVSMYERRRKVPTLEVVERLMLAAGTDLGMVTAVVWDVDYLPGSKEFYYPSRLWRVEVPFCFAKVVMPDLTRQTRQGLWDLRDRADRRRLYEMLLVLGTPEQILRWVDGALLVDIWRELEIPRPVRRSWESVVQEGARGPTERASH
jgi:transcriptional regulator with XRE-family HTH domain